MNRDDRWALVQGGLLALAIVLLATAVHARDGLPAGYSCADVRRFVAEQGKVRALAMAMEQGASLSQIRAARKCLDAK